MEKKYEGFWLGRSWVSRCSRCGDICFTVAQEKEHSEQKCDKAKLKPLTAEQLANPPGEQR